MQTPDWDYIEATNEVARARPDVTIISYTHAWPDLDPTWFDYTVNASCETEEDVLKAAAAGWQTVITLTGMDDPLIGTTIADRRVIVCPEQTRDDVTCKTCKLCAKPDRACTVGFLAHGTRKRAAAEALGR